jgi:rod shape-determining protein MreC
LGNLFPFDIKKIILVLFIFSLPLISINFQRAPGEIPWYMRPVHFVAGSVEEGYSSFSNTVRGTTAQYLDLISIKRENEGLKAEKSELTAKLARFDELMLENQRLAKLLDFKSHMPSHILPARVIGQDLFSSQYRTIRIDRGIENGVSKGMAVITPDGVVGYVFAVDSNTAQVLVVTDRYAVVDAVVQRTRARGIIEGKTETTATLKYLHRSDDVQSGDLIVTSGLDNIFPQGFPIGHVTQVERKSYDITQKVEIEPIVRLARLEEVFVMMKTVNPPPAPAQLPTTLPSAAAPLPASLPASLPKPGTPR